MELTCWVWLVALGSTGVANAEIPQIGCWTPDWPSDQFLGTGSPDECKEVAAAMNKLDGVSDVTCNNYPFDNIGLDVTVSDFTWMVTDTEDECNAVAAALNKLDGVSDVECLYHSLKVESDGNCHAVQARLTAILQGPTCKNGNPIPGPSGGGNCTGACDQGWCGCNCDSPSPPPSPALAAHPPNYLMMWKHFQKAWPKVYAVGEENKRFEVFKTNVDLISMENVEGHSHQLGVTKFADMTKEDLKWEDMLPILELVDTPDELLAAIEDSDAFFKKLGEKNLVAMKKYTIARLRLKLEPKLKEKGFKWGDVVVLLEAVDTTKELLDAIEDPDTFIARKVQTYV